MSQEELSKREEDRINRTLSNIGKRPTRPVSWNVPQNPVLAGGPLGSIGRREAVGVKFIQEQIREEERRQATVSQAQQHPHLISPPHHPQQQQQYTQPPQQPYHSSEIVEDDAEKERKLKVEEERLSRWMRKGDIRFEENKTGSDARARASSVDSFAFPVPDHSTAAVGINSKLASTTSKFQEQVHLAAKAIRQRKHDEVVMYSLSVTAIATTIASANSADAEILGHVRTLELAASTLRNTIDTGGDPENNYAEVATLLGLLTISAFGVL